MGAQPISAGTVVKSQLIVALACALAPLAATDVRAQAKSQPDIIAPRTFTTMKDLVPQIQSVIQGVVEDVHFDYDDCAGPRTIIRLTGVETLLGGPHEQKIELRTFGGPLPNGSFMAASELPRYVLGARYLLVLRNTDWRFSPVIGDLAFRQELIAGKQVLVNTDGFGVTGVDDAGIHTGTVQLTLPVGQRVIGIKVTREEQSEYLAPPPAQAGRAEACERKACGDTQKNAGVLRAREALIASGRFARPSVTEGVGPEAVKDAIPVRELVALIDRWATARAVRIGGYYAETPRIGCWGRTTTERPRD